MFGQIRARGHKRKGTIQSLLGIDKGIPNKNKPDKGNYKKRWVDLRSQSDMLRYSRRLISSLVTRLRPDRTGASTRLLSPLGVKLRPEGGGGALPDGGGLRAVLGPCLRDDGGCGCLWGDRTRSRLEDGGCCCLEDEGCGCLSGDCGSGRLVDLDGIGGGGGVWDGRALPCLEAEPVGSEVKVGG